MIRCRHIFLLLFLASGHFLLNAQRIPLPVDSHGRGAGLLARDIDGTHAIPVPGKVFNRWAIHSASISMRTLWMVHAASLQLNRKRWSVQAVLLLSGQNEWAVWEMNFSYTHQLHRQLVVGLILDNRIIPADNGMHYLPELGFQVLGLSGQNKWALRVNGMIQIRQKKSYELRNPAFELAYGREWRPGWTFTTALCAKPQTDLHLIAGIRAEVGKLVFGLGCSSLLTAQIDMKIPISDFQFRLAIHYAEFKGYQPSTAFGGTW